MAKTSIDDLVLYESTAQDMPDAEQDRVIKHGMFVLRGCARQIIGGLEEDIKRCDFPPQKYTIYRGKQAYSHMLEFVTGQLAKTRGESQVVHQFKRSWLNFSKQNPEKATALHYLYQSLIADNGLIRNSVTADLQPAYFESAAHDLSEQKGGETVLVVASPHASGKGPDEVTMNILKQLGNNRKQSAGRILLTHPDPKVLRGIMGPLNGTKKLAVKVEPVPFKRALAMNMESPDPESLIKTERVFVALRMNESPEVDKQIYDAWSEREAFGGKLVHLGGPTKEDRVSKGIWAKHDLYNAVMPEDICQQQKVNQGRNEMLLKAGKLAAENCACSRVHGKNPVKLYIGLPTEDYAKRVGLVREGAARAKAPGEGSN